MRARPEPISPSAAAQSRAGSILETFAHTLARFFVSVFATAHVLPLVGVSLPLRENLAASAVMTLIHAVLTYAIRRLFVRFSERRAQ